MNRENKEGGSAFEGMVGRSKALQDIITFIIRVADEDDPVLIQGETGTGKELIAKAIHNQSGRKDEPFVVVDCSNMLPFMKGSMLFGQEETAFPGAAAYKGKLETVRNGTLFLDQVDALYHGLQEMLIPVIKEKRFQRIGGKADIPLRARIVSATNEDLADLVSQGGFILGLYRQLNELHMEVPPLRERKEDIPLLVGHFIRENWNRKKRGPKGISEEAMKRLMQHNWPGNVLELKGRIEVGCTFADQKLIMTDHIVGI